MEEEKKHPERSSISSIYSDVIKKEKPNTSRELRGSVFHRNLNNSLSRLQPLFDDNLLILADELSEYGSKESINLDGVEIDKHIKPKKNKSAPPKATTDNENKNADEHMLQLHIDFKSSRNRIHPPLIYLDQGTLSLLKKNKDNSRGSDASTVVEIPDKPRVYSLGLNFFSLGVYEIIDYTQEIIYQLSLCQPEQQKNLGNLVETIILNYNNSNPYHNHTHGFAVFHMASLIFSACPDFKHLYTKDQALRHDVGHPGYSNKVEVEYKSVLAIQTNNKAVLETYHAAKLISFLRNSSCDIFGHLDPMEKLDQWKFITKLIISTDGSLYDKHHKTVEECKTIYQVFGKGHAQLSDQEQDRKRIARFSNAVLHACDLSAQLSDLDVAVEWGNRVAKEFQNEAHFYIDDDHKVPNHMLKYSNQLETKAFYSEQIWFVKKLVMPIWKPLIKNFFPELVILKFSLEKNLNFYEEASKEESDLTVKKSMKPYEGKGNIMNQLYSALLKKQQEGNTDNKSKRSSKKSKKRQKFRKSRKSGKQRFGGGVKKQRPRLNSV
eukprot:snap_masked-scaffold_93-processed-gene-0.26-mRNA-1 protein AED:1.00 eAED:1.00 QI:0/0/0/0/1/1/2/0/549